MRTLLVTMPPLLADLVARVLQPHLTLDVVETLATRDDVIERLRAHAPELVLLGLSGGETDSVADPLLAAQPSTAVLVFAPNGATAWLHAQQPQRTAMPDLSVEALTRTLTARFPPAQP